MTDLACIKITNEYIDQTQHRNVLLNVFSCDANELSEHILEKRHFKDVTIIPR